MYASGGRGQRCSYDKFAEIGIGIQTSDLALLSQMCQFHASLSHRPTELRRVRITCSLPYNR